jgi:hypothetical protein
VLFHLCRQKWLQSQHCQMNPRCLGYQLHLQILASWQEQHHQDFRQLRQYQRNQKLQRYRRFLQRRLYRSMY